MKRTTLSERVLVLAVRGRDAPIAVTILQEGGLTATACPSILALLAELDLGAALVVVTEESLATADLNGLNAWLGDQQEWSDLPFILLTQKGGGLERNPTASRYLGVLGNVVFLERPFHSTTLVSLARSALRARLRQYEAPWSRGPLTMSLSLPTPNAALPHGRKAPKKPWAGPSMK